MTSLDELFPDGPRDSDRPSFVLDDRHTVRRLSAMIGDPRERSTGLSTTSSVDELTRMVERTKPSAARVVSTAERAPMKRRRGRHIDRLAVGLGGLSVVALAAALTVGGVQMATASPASAALKSLQADEATLQNAQQRLVAARDRLGADLEAGIEDAQQLRVAIDSTAAAPDPAGGENETIEIVDPAALTTVRGAMDAYESGLAGIEAPAVPEEYVRGDIDEDSLSDVGEAINQAQAHIAEIDEADAELRDLRAQLDALKETHEQSLVAFAGTFPAAATTLLGNYPDAEESLRTAVTDAAARVAASGAFGAEGVAALTAYRDAVVAVAEDQLSADIERREQEEAEERRRTQPDPVTTSPPVEPTPPPTDPENPPAEPTDPIVP